MEREVPPSDSWFAVPYEVDAGIGNRAHIGMVVISNDQTLSHEAHAMLKIPGVALYESRILTSRQRNQAVSAEVLKSQMEKIDAAVRQINSIRPSDVVALGCTYAAMVIGLRELERRVREVHPDSLVTEPFTGIKTALRSLGSNSVGLVSPYPRKVASQMAECIEAEGIKVKSICTFHNDSGFVSDEAAFISPASIANAVRATARSAEVDTVIVACTQMRAAAIIGSLERETGKKVISSNQALCWHALRLTGCEDIQSEWGQLFQASLPRPAKVPAERASTGP
ncbi:Asp/Glu/hydantoin racemase [Burkholderia sp. JPY481]